LGWRAQSREIQRPTRSSRAGLDRTGARAGNHLPMERSPRPLAGPGANRLPERPRPLNQRPHPRHGRRGKEVDTPLPETGEPLVVRQARAEFAKFAAVFGGCFMIDVATGFGFPWSLIVGGAMSFSLFKKYADLWQAGYSWRDIVHRPDAPDAVGSGVPRALKGSRHVPLPRVEEFGQHHARMMEVHRDRQAVLNQYERLSQADRAMVPDLIETVDNLYLKAHELGSALHAMDSSLAPDELERIDKELELLQRRD